LDFSSNLNTSRKRNIFFKKGSFAQWGNSRELMPIRIAWKTRPQLEQRAMGRQNGEPYFFAALLFWGKRLILQNSKPAAGWIYWRRAEAAAFL
jgi:hypothetical protein